MCYHRPMLMLPASARNVSIAQLPVGPSGPRPRPQPTAPKVPAAAKVAAGAASAALMTAILLGAAYALK